ncbi:hypothetical protein [Pseudomonas orientalis]|jgi:hypothetical protein|uniref:hypothetical protein n=1 Tax=Pseudomonas orientalis TaxID=76758 RepID=UPI0034D5B2B7
MGGIKRTIEENESKYNEALKIAVEAGTLQECDNHDGTYFSDSGDIEEAEEFAREQFSKGEVHYFDDENELVEAVRAVSEENSAEQCFSCDVD